VGGVQEKTLLNFQIPLAWKARSNVRKEVRGVREEGKKRRRGPFKNCHTNQMRANVLRGTISGKGG